MSTKCISVSTEVLDFLTEIHGNREDKERRKKDIFDQAFKQAYRDMSTHTVAYTDDAKNDYVKDDSTRCKKNKEEIRKGIKEKVIKNIFGDVSLSELKTINTHEDFDKWHKDACEKLNKIGDLPITELQPLSPDSKKTEKISNLLCHTSSKIDSKIYGVFTYGQAQKLINMMVKYLYIYYQCYKCEGWKKIENLKNFAHVPIDSYVLKEIFKEKTDEEAPKTPWSKIESYDDYIKYKEKIDAHVKSKNEIDKKENYDSAFMWELANWPFDN